MAPFPWRTLLALAISCVSQVTTCYGLTSYVGYMAEFLQVVGDKDNAGETPPRVFMRLKIVPINSRRLLGSTNGQRVLAHPAGLLSTIHDFYIYKASTDSTPKSSRQCGSPPSIVNDHESVRWYSHCVSRVHQTLFTAAPTLVAGQALVV